MCKGVAWSWAARAQRNDGHCKYWLAHFKSCNPCTIAQPQKHSTRTERSVQLIATSKAGSRCRVFMTSSPALVTRSVHRTSQVSTTPCSQHQHPVGRPPAARDEKQLTRGQYHYQTQCIACNLQRSASPGCFVVRFYSSHTRTAHEHGCADGGSAPDSCLLASVHQVLELHEAQKPLATRKHGLHTAGHPTADGGGGGGRATLQASR